MLGFLKITHVTNPIEATIAVRMQTPPIEIAMIAQTGSTPDASAFTTYLLASQALLHSFS